MKSLLARLRVVLAWRWLGPSLALASYALGVAWRWVFLFRVHRPQDFVYSDMGMYVELGKRLSRDNYKLQQYDVTHPPGMSELIAYHYRSDHSLLNLVRVQFAVTILVPIAICMLAWLAFDRKAGLWALVVSSFYLPFVDYGGYFLAEVYLTFTATLTMTLYLGAVRLSYSVTRPPETVDPSGAMQREADVVDTRVSRPRSVASIACALVAGFAFSVAMVMKMVAAPAILCFLGLHFLFTKTPASWKTKAVLIAALGLGAFPLSKWQADRCTRGNQGQFCPGSNKAPADFLMGHIGRVQGVTWTDRDPKRPERIRSQIGFGSPAAYQHGYGKKAEFNFKITDGEANKREAWKWINANPGQAVVLSFEHVWDSFGGSLPWPAVATKYWATSQAFHYLFLAFLFFPTLVLLLDVARSRGLLGLLRSHELLVVSPIFGIIVSVMMATGEVRYRIPWDMCFIVAAIQFYRSLRIRLREPAVAVAVAVAGPAPAAAVVRESDPPEVEESKTDDPKPDGSSSES